jgi:hypothetical protein
VILDFDLMDFLKIKSQIKSSYFNTIEKITKSSKYDFKSDFAKSQIKSFHTLDISAHKMPSLEFNFMHKLADL